MTTEAVPKNLDLFSIPPTLLSVSEYRYEKINSKTAMGRNVKQIDFTANPDKVNYTDLSESYFLIKCGYEKADQSAVEAAPLIGPIQNPLTSIMKSVDVWINNVKVTPNEGDLPFINFLHNFMQSKQAKESYLTTSLWVDDSYDSITSCNQSNPQAAADANPNKGLKERTGYFTSSRDVLLIGKVYIPPHNVTKLFLPHLKFDWRIELTDIAFHSMSAQPAGSYHFWVKEAAIMLRRVTVSPSLSLAHSTILQSRNALYPCRYMLSRTYNIPTGSSDFKFPNAFEGK